MFIWKMDSNFNSNNRDSDSDSKQQQRQQQQQQQQHVTEPTRHRENTTSNLLDLVLSSEKVW